MINISLILLVASFLLVAFALRLGLSPIVGFILAGVLIGPHGLGVVADSHAIRQMGEFGIVFLMFTIGLEFSLSRLIADRYAVLVAGGLQVLLTTVLFTLAAQLLQVTFLTAVTLAVALAMSSTAIVSRMLIEQGEVSSRYGRTTICILLFQDLATIIVLMILPVVSAEASTALGRDLALALAKGVMVFLVLLFAGRWLVQRSFRYLARLHSPELFMLGVLVVSLGAAQFAHLMGLSLALGGFMAGMVIGETEFRHQVEADIRPFQDVLLGLFFVTIGMLVDPALLAGSWPAVLGAAAGLVLVKGALAFGVTRTTTSAAPLAIRIGITLAHGGEFSLMLIFLALQLGMIDAELGQVVLTAVLLSMVTAPFAIRHSAALSARLSGVGRGRTQRGIADRIESAATDLSAHVILCGYGRVGRNIAWYLDEESVEYVALDIDLQHLRAPVEPDRRLTYGDATRRHILIAAGLERAQAVVITFDNVRAALKVLSHVHEIRPDVTAIVRSADEQHLDELLNAGATEVIPGTLEISLILATHVLTLLGVPVSKITEHNERIRADRYRLMRGVLHGHRRPERREQVRVIRIGGDDFAVGRTLEELDVEALGTRVTAVRRHGIRGAAPEPHMRLADKDDLIVAGPPEALARVEDYLAKGSERR